MRSGILATGRKSYMKASNYGFVLPLPKNAAKLSDSMYWPESPDPERPHG